MAQSTVPATPAAEESPSAPLFSAASTSEPRQPSVKRKKPASLPLKPLLIGGGGLALVVVIGLVTMLFFGGSKPSATPTRSDKTMLVIKWPEEERRAAALTINGKNVQFPKKGPVEIRVEPGKQVVGILRRDFEAVRHEVTIARGETQSVKPDFKAVAIATPPSKTKTLQETPQIAQNPADPGTEFKLGGGVFVKGFEGWEQLLTIAKEKAAKEKKDILIVFGSSDGNADTIRLATALQTAGFPKGALAEKYVPLVIDFPETDLGENGVVDKYQNRDLGGEYTASRKTLPMLALTDDQGLPYGVERTWPKGVKDVESVLDQLSTQKAKRDELFAATKVADLARQIAASVKFIDWIQTNKMLTQYRASIHPWWRIAQEVDPDNKAGQLEVVLEAEIYCQLRELPNDVRVGRAEVVRRLDALEPWLTERKFRDEDRGFRLHFIAANVLGNLGDEQNAIAHLRRANSYEPKTAEWKDRKKEFGLTPDRDLDVLSSGTGFVISSGGFVLTNRHVVDGAGRVAARIAGVKEPVPAKIVEIHDELDIALLQIDFPESFQPTSVPLNQAAKLSRGAEVAAFGFPQGDQLGKDLKFTRGSISGLPNPALDNMILLDLRVNPGNSGGPLCDSLGNVIGMITAKTGGANLDSYGMAIPAVELDKFLNEYLPKEAQRAKPHTRKPEDGWAEVDTIISPAVIMIVKTR